MISVAVGGCEKFLSEKPDSKLAVISNLDDAQALLDYYPSIDRKDVGVGEESADNYYLSDAEYAKRAESDQRIYLWEKDHLFLPDSKDWRQGYENIYTANAVLEALGRIVRVQHDAFKYNNLKGQALLLRGRTYLMLVWVWGNAYKQESASGKLGVPLRLNTNFNEKIPRSSLADTYRQAMDDLRAAALLLPLKGDSKLRASRPVAWGWLSRASLSMNEFSNAGNYADSVLKYENGLLDYNKLNASAAYPIPEQNAEVIMDTRLGAVATLVQSRAKMDTTLLSLYDGKDLRKKIFFKLNTDGSYAFKGNYAGGPTFFSGIATDEMLLTRAECLARGNQSQKALNDLNLLLTNRYDKSFIPIQNITQEALIQRILLERRKELLFRGIRWMDVKRQNTAGGNIVMKRRINGQEALLPPNDPRYALAIPENVIELGEIQDNPR